MSQSEPNISPATSAAFARIAGFKPSYIRQLRLDGRLVMAEGGKLIDVAASLARIGATRDPSKVGVSARHAANRGAGEKTAVDARVDAPQDLPPGPSAYFDASSSPKYQQARARKEEALALSAERDYELSMGKLAEMAVVVATVASNLTLMRVKLETLGSLLAPQVAPETDEARCKALIDDIIERALSDLERGFRNLALVEVGA